MTRCTFTFLLCVCASFVLHAQQTKKGPLLKFSTQTCWVGIFEGETAEYRFRFVNAGDQPLVITEVSQSFFVPDSYTKQPVAPGDSGFVLLQYNPGDKTGYFEKTATVVSNSRDGNVVLYLRGSMRERPAPDAPIMQFDTLICWFDTVYQGSIVDHEFRFTNKGKTPLIISMVTGSSGSIVPYYPKEPIAPGQSAFIRFVFSTTGKYGPQDKTLTVISNASEPTILLHLKGFVTMPQPPPDDDGPMLKIDAPVFDFDTVEQGDTLMHEFRFRNTGKSPLLISSVIGSGGGCICWAFPKEPIPPNGTGVITIMFITSGKLGAQDKTQTITSNSVNGQTVIHMRGTVVARGNK